ncbi:MAG TPA: agmatinase [Bacillota bacterium]|nr:agmatinase [Bacillota bacterium]
MLELMDKPQGFMGSTESYEDADTVIAGIPMDFTVSFRPGTRHGAEAVRSVSIGIEEYSLELDRDLADYAYYDAGDISLPFGQVEKSLERIGQVAEKLLVAGKFPIFIGGEHLVSLPIIEKVAKKYPGLKVIHFDAHADLREHYLGEPISHATVMRRVCDIVGPENVYQFGIRSGTREEFQYARENTNTFVKEVLAPLTRLLRNLEGSPIYVTLDIDVVDPAFAPGTGTAEADGCTSGEILAAVRMLGHLQVVGFDLVEISPIYDQSQRTALLGAKIVREAILAFTQPARK